MESIFFAWPYQASGRQEGPADASAAGLFATCTPVQGLTKIHTEEGVAGMAQGDVETYYEDGQWKNKREGTNRAYGG
ncbi:hypothetical protein ASG92_24010 [Arthrobacter sp. Soil736]|nr:hypothetical protein ASG92_24010 [Arthrobacter sp. Soil736]